MKVFGSYGPTRTPVTEKIVQAAVSAAKKHGVDSVVWPTYYAYVPLSIFTDPPLRLPAVSAGLGRMGREHSSNEYITIEGLKLYEKYTVTYLNEFAENVTR